MFNKIKKILQKDQLILFAVGTTASFIMFMLFYSQPSFLRQLDSKVYDQLLTTNHRPKATDVPIIIDLDEQSLREFGQWPWPRYRVTMLLKYLQAYGASSIATDIVFGEPDRTSPVVLQQQLKKEMNIHIDIKGVPAALRDNDILLAHNLKTGPFVLGIDFIAKSNLSPEQLKRKNASCFGKPINISVRTKPGYPQLNETLFNAEEAICPIPALAQAAPMTGFITIAPDEDSLYRRVPLIYSWQNAFYPSLALAALMQATNTKSLLVKMSPIGIESINFAGTIIPTDERGQLLINFRGPMKTFEYISAADVLTKKLKPGALQGKIVFLGTSAAGLKDIRAIPLDPGYPGVEAHATIVDNILSKEFLSVPDWTIGVEAITTLGLGFIVTVLLMWISAAWLILPLIGLSYGLWFSTEFVYIHYGYYVSPLYPFLNLGLTFLLLTIVKFWREEHAKKFIHGAFAHYLAPSVISQIIENPDALTLEGQEKEITIQFSDVRSFTSLSEKLTPTQVTNLLHDYLTPMTRIITEHGGTLDKFIGDAVMAFWNAPLDIENHQGKSLSAAIAQLQKLDELNEIFINKYGFTIAVGIGIHCGSVRVGNMGSADLFDYTLIGDNVNLASRLEGLTKFYGQTLIVSQKIKDACDGAYHFQLLDKVRVKGKEEPVTIYTAYPLDQAAQRADEIEQYNIAHQKYLNMQFSEAQNDFLTLDSLGTEPQLYKIYIERCNELQSNPPEPNWDGVFTHKTK